MEIDGEERGRESYGWRGRRRAMGGSVLATIRVLWLWVVRTKKKK